MRTVSQFGQRSVMRQAAHGDALPFGRVHEAASRTAGRRGGRAALAGAGGVTGQAAARLAFEHEHVALGAVGKDEPFDVAVAHVVKSRGRPGRPRVSRRRSLVSVSAGVAPGLTPTLATGRRGRELRAMRYTSATPRIDRGASAVTHPPADNPAADRAGTDAADRAGTDAADPAALRARPIGMFDSGIGGLTVLHECLVAMPAEDFVYLGDTARFPYGLETQDELRLFARQIATFLDDSGVKLLVVACYSATAAALPALQEQFSTPIVGVVMPGARAAVQTSRYRRIGVLATEATVASGSYVRAIGSARRRRRGDPAGLPRSCVVHPGGRRRQPRDRGRRAALHGAAQGAAPRRRHHGLHALPADRAHAAAPPRSRRYAGQPGRRDRPRGGGGAAAPGRSNTTPSARARTASSAPARSTRFAPWARGSCRCRSTTSSRSALERLGGAGRP